jgi:superfamily I DNA and/or RNA helicase
MNNTEVEAHFEQLRRALEAEREEERHRFEEAARTLSLEERQERGWALADLVARDISGGVGGRRLISFERERGELGSSRLGAGSPVRATRRKTRTDDDPHGVVVRASRKRITVAFEPDAPDWLDEGLIALELLADDTTFERTRSGLRRLVEAKSGRLEEHRRVLGGLAPPRFDATLAPRPDSDALAKSFNEPQREAVRLALSAKDIALVHGPPGTGKTTVLVEIGRLAVARGQKLLACAASNAAVDLLAQRLSEQNLNVVRLGHPARVDEAVQHLTLEARIEAHERYQLGRRLMDEAFRLWAQARKLQARGRAADRFSEARAKQKEASALRKEAMIHEAAAEQEILDKAQVVASTMAGLNPQRLGERRFGLALLDEASQATEPLALLPFERADVVILAGDAQQLPPTVLSAQATKLGLNVSLFERLLTEHGPSIKRMLEVQHRMHQRIQTFPSAHFYEGKLVAHESVAKHLLYELPGIKDEERTREPFVFIDTAGTGYQEETPENSQSKRNVGEAELLRNEVNALLESGLSPEQIAVIAPYEAQVRLLRELLPQEGLEIDTVDAFQGREKEAVLVSLVRSNSDGELGFLTDVRRMNVAITRARRRLWVVGDSATIAAHPFYSAFLDAVAKNGRHVSAWELMPPA